MNRKFWLGLAVGCGMVLATACDKNDDDSSSGDMETGGAQPTGGPEGIEVRRSSQAYVAEVDVPAADGDALRAGARAFALDLFREVAGQSSADENVCLGTNSVNTVLAMTSAGARGVTETELAAVLQHGLAPEALHPAMNQLGQELRAEFAGTAATYRALDSLWLATDLEVSSSFLDVLSQHYDTGIYLVDFAGNAELARGRINGWVAEQTAGFIPELFATGSLDEDVELALTNAAYLSAPWRDRFYVDSTFVTEFSLADGNVVDVACMEGQHKTPFALEADWGAVELPFLDANAGMILVLPNEGEYAALEASFDAGLVDRIVGALEAAADANEMARLRIPKFDFSTSVDLRPALEGLGAPSMFDPATADLSGIEATGYLYVRSFLHQTTVAIDEDGMTAAAASGEPQAWGSIPPQLFFTRPFLFFVYDHGTGTVLFIGRFVRPPGEARAPTAAP